MTLDEAALILNVKKDTPLEQVLKVCNDISLWMLVIAEHLSPELRASVQSQLTTTKTCEGGARQAHIEKEPDSRIFTLPAVQGRAGEGTMGSRAQGVRRSTTTTSGSTSASPAPTRQYCYPASARLFMIRPD